MIGPSGIRLLSATPRGASEATREMEMAAVARPFAVQRDASTTACSTKLAGIRRFLAVLRGASRNALDTKPTGIRRAFAGASALAHTGRCRTHRAGFLVRAALSDARPRTAQRAFCSVLLGVQLLFSQAALAVSLKEAYESAPAASGYDKYVVLETGVTYTGGLWIGATFDRISAEFVGEGVDVRIVGNGAIIDLQGEEICFAYCANRLDIDDCVILHGDIRFRGYDDGVMSLVPTGSVRYVTFYEPHDYAVRMFRCGSDVLVERNLVVGAVDTGSDFMYLTGYANDWLPTGASFGLSLTAGFDVQANWTYHGDPVANADPLRHFTIMCDYG